MSRPYNIWDFRPWKRTAWNQARALRLIYNTNDYEDRSELLSPLGSGSVHALASGSLRHDSAGARGACHPGTRDATASWPPDFDSRITADGCRESCRFRDGRARDRFERTANQRTRT